MCLFQQDEKVFKVVCIILCMSTVYSFTVGNIVIFVIVFFFNGHIIN